MSEANSDRPTTSKEAIVAIIVTGVVLLACIAACALISVVFLLNAPWKPF